ncbi:unnamed protein product, partial [Iphiclides podalirius]
MTSLHVYNVALQPRVWWEEQYQRTTALSPPYFGHAEKLYPPTRICHLPRTDVTNSASAQNDASRGDETLKENSITFENPFDSWLVDFYVEEDDLLFVPLYLMGVDILNREEFVVYREQGRPAAAAAVRGTPPADLRDAKGQVMAGMLRVAVPVQFDQRRPPPTQQEL